MEFIPNDWARLHHAYIISGLEVHLLWDALSKNLSFKKKANPDARYLQYETFGIDEARELSDWALNKPIAGEKKVAVVSVLSFTVEAQNALLKLFEEPTLGTHFFILVPQNVFLLSTLLSRVRIVNHYEKENANKKYSSFFFGTISERLNMVKNIIKTKDKEKARLFLKYLEEHSANLNHKTKYQEASVILNAEKMIRRRGSSVKLILEHLALSLPNDNL